MFIFSPWNKSRMLFSSKYLITLWLVLTHCLAHSQHNNSLCRADPKDILYYPLHLKCKCHHSNNGDTRRHYNGLQIIKISVFQFLCLVVELIDKMYFTVTHEQLNYYIIRHHRYFVMQDLIMCLWGRRGLLRQVTLEYWHQRLRNRRGSSYELVRENIQGCGPCFKWHSARLFFHAIFQNK